MICNNNSNVFIMTITALEHSNRQKFCQSSLHFLLGRCKSAYHQFLYDLMDSVQHRAAQRGLKPKTVFLPHCTWDKLGDILANAGGRCMGLFDELLSSLLWVCTCQWRRKCLIQKSMKTSCKCTLARQRQERPVSTWSLIYTTNIYATNLYLK